jgi:FkbH-like protein
VLSHYHRGVILALCSKNNEQDVWEVFDTHPDMLLKREHFAAWRINWDDKAANLRALAAELNIGTDSLVFADDSDFESNLIREQMPEVAVLQLPVDRPGEYRWLLAGCGAFDLPYLTEEDRKRGEMYQAQNVRAKEKAGSTDIEAYCRSLAMVLEIGRADSFSTPRIAQQTQKTNQFNLTTRRYTEADIEGFASSGTYDVLWLRLADKFGDMGIIGTCIVSYPGQDASIDTLLLSCRALGRGVEARFLHEVMALAARRGARRMVGQYIPTAKNVQVADFYVAHGFQPLDGDQGKFTFDLDRLPQAGPGAFVSVATPPGA